MFLSFTVRYTEKIKLINLFFFYILKAVFALWREQTLITAPRVHTGADNQTRQCSISDNVSDNSSDATTRQGDKLTKFVCV